MSGWVGGLIQVKSVLQSNDDFGGRDDDLYRLSVRGACGDGERVAMVGGCLG